MAIHTFIDRRGRPSGRQKLADVCEIQCVDAARVESARRALRSPESTTALAETFRVLSDPTRLRIVQALGREELCVCDLAALLSLSQSTVSHSLRALRQLRLVRFRKAGKIAYYVLDDDRIAALVSAGFIHVEERK